VNRMRLMFEAMVVVAGVVVAQTVLAVPSLAAPSNDPCPLQMALMCRFLPIAPDLDGDVDLSKQPPAGPTDPASRPDATPPADVCARGCY
jgi:hypothetical protein